VVIKSGRISWARHVARRGDMHTGFWWRKLKERNHLEEPGAYGNIILRSSFRKWYGEVRDWIDFSQNRDRWRALVKAVIKFHLPINVGNINFIRRTLLHGVS